MRVAARALPPRCMYAAFRTIMNAWCTAARFGGDKDCVFCGAISCDRIQHVRQCPAVCDALYVSLASPFSLPEVLSFIFFFLLGCTNPSRMLRGIIILDILYRAYTAARHRTARPDAKWIRDTVNARLRTLAIHSADVRILIGEYFRIA